MERTDWKSSLGRSWPAVVFTLLLALHLLLATRNFSAGFLVGHEFRQTQTALSAYFIQQEGNYSLAYPTPVLGKPWSIPMEFPLYHWGVAKLSDATGWPIQVSGRAISLLSFYLTLPALWLLFAEAGIARRGRWLALAVVVAAPVHIFYARAVLIETLAAAFAVWHVAAFCRWMRTRQFAWLVIAATAGIGLALVKVTTAMVWLALSGAVTLWWARAALRDSLRSAVVLLGRAALAAAAPIAAALWWVHTSDQIKSLSPGGRDLRSAEMTHFNFGTLADRFDAGIWRQLIGNWSQGISPLWLGVPLLVFTAVVVRRQIWPALVAFALPVAGSLTFIQLYRWHDYYFVAVATAAAAAIGLAIAALDQHPRARVLGALAFAAVIAAQLHSYATHYAPLQFVPSNGGSNLTDVIRDATPANGVIIVAGDDWAPLVPYYAKRRALMVQAHKVGDIAYLEEAFANLKDEDVTLLVLKGPMRTNEEFRARVIRHFKLNDDIVVSDVNHDVYASPDVHDAICRHMERYPNYSSVTLRGKARPPVAKPKQFPLIADNTPHEVQPAQVPEFLGLVQPAPHRYSCRFGFGAGQLGEQTVLGAHPDSALWVGIPRGATKVTVGFGLLPATYQAGQETTDGVCFEVVLQPKSGPETELFRRELLPASVPADQGTQEMTINLPAGASGELVFRTSPRASMVRDWAYWSKIEVR